LYFYVLGTLFSLFAECPLKIVAAGTVPNTARLHRNGADALYTAVSLSSLKYRADTRSWLQHLVAKTEVLWRMVKVLEDITAGMRRLISTRLDGTQYAGTSSFV
jgi:hypothetical protein